MPTSFFPWKSTDHLSYGGSNGAGNVWISQAIGTMVTFELGLTEDQSANLIRNGLGLSMDCERLLSFPET